MWDAILDNPLLALLCRENTSKQHTTLVDHMGNSSDTANSDVSLMLRVCIQHFVFSGGWQTSYITITNLGDGGLSSAGGSAESEHISRSDANGKGLKHRVEWPCWIGETHLSPERARREAGGMLVQVLDESVIWKRTTSDFRLQSSPYKYSETDQRHFVQRNSTCLSSLGVVTDVDASSTEPCRLRDKLFGFAS